MSDVMQFKDVLSHAARQGAVQSVQRRADPLADPLQQPLQAPIQLRTEAAPARPEAEAAKEPDQGKTTQAKAANPAAPAAEAAEEEAAPAETEAKVAQAKADAGTKAAPSGAPAGGSSDPIQLKSAPEEESSEGEAEGEGGVTEAKLELGGGDPGGDDAPAGDDGGGDPIQAKGAPGGDSALPSGPPAGDAPEPSGGGDAPTGGGAPTGGASAAPAAPAPSAPSPAPAPSAPAPATPGASGGSPLPAPVQSKMEQSFGTDLSGVRVREDASAKALGAQAYTQGNTITFAPGKYSPETKSGQELLGHEIAHTRQQAAGVVKPDATQNKGGVAMNTDAGLEAEADRAGAAAAEGKPAVVASAGSGAQAKAAQAKAEPPAIARGFEPVQAKVVQLKENPDDKPAPKPTTTDGGQNGPVTTPEGGQTAVGEHKTDEEWTPVYGNSMEENYFEGERFTVTEKGGKPVKAYIVFRVALGTYQSNKPGPDGFPVNSVIPKGAAFGVSKRLAPSLEAHFRTLIETKGLAAAKAASDAASFKWEEKEKALPIYDEENKLLFDAVKIRLSRVGATVDLDENREANRKEFDEWTKSTFGKRSNETDKYWVAEGKAPPGVGAEEWEKIQRDEKAKLPGGGKVEVEEGKPDKKASALPFVTEKFEPKIEKQRKKGDEYTAPPRTMALKGTVHTISKNPAEKKGDEGQNNIALMNQNKARRAVASLLPDLVQKRIVADGYAKATDPKARKQIGEIAKVMAQYDAERFDLDLDLVEFDVVADEKADEAIQNAMATGEGVETETPKVDWGLTVDKKGIARGHVEIPLINVGGGMIAKNLNGDLEWDTKKNQLVSFGGGATVIVPFGANHVFEITCENLKIKQGADVKIKTASGKIELPTFVVQEGKGTFKVATPIDLFTTKDGTKWALAPGANGSVVIEKARLKTIEGAVDLEVTNAADEKLFGLKLQGKYNFDKESKLEPKAFNGTAIADVFKDLPFASEFGPDKTWTAFVEKGTHADATVVSGALTKVNGTLKARVDDGKDPWLVIAATGDYDHQKRTGNIPDGTIDVVKSTVVGRFGEGKEIVLEQGTLAKATLKDNALTKASGSLLALVKSGGKDTLRVKAKGSWTPDQGLDGDGEAKLLDDLDFQVGTGAVKVYTGASGQAVVKSGVLQTVQGSARAQVTAKMGEQTVVVGLEGSGFFDVANKNVVEAHGRAKLDQPLKIGKNISVDAVDGEIGVANNELVSINGMMAATFSDEKGPLVGGMVDGSWSKATNTVDGTAKVDLRRDLTVKLGAGVSAVVKAGPTKIGATVVKSEVTEVTGGLAVSLLRNERQIATLKASDAVYDVKNNVLKSLVATATLDEKFDLLEGKLSLTKLVGTVTIAGGKLANVAVDASLAAPIINLPAANVSFTWRNDGTKDLYSFKGSIKKWTLFKGKERSLEGDLDLAYNEDGTFLANTKITYVMAKGFKATGDLTIDQTLIPTVNKLTFGFSTQLADKTDLFEFDTQIVKLFIPILVFRLSLGIDMGSSLKMLPITLAGNFSVENWKPGTDEENQVPNFSAQLNLGMGFDFEVWLRASLEASLDVLVAAVGIGADATLKLKVPIRIKPSLTLEGGPKGWSGAFGLDVDITPELLLTLSAYLFADIVFFDPWEYEMGEWPFDLGKLPGLKWSDTFAFGDNKAAKPKAKTPVKPTDGEKSKKGSGKKVTKKASEIEAPKPPKGEQKSQNAELPGGTPISGDTLLGKQKEGAGNKDAEGKDASENQLGLIMEAAKGLQAVDTFIKFIKDCASYVLKSGPIVGPLMLAWDVYTGKISLEELKKAWKDFTNGIKAAGKLMKGMSDDQFSFTYRMGRWMAGEITAWQLIMESDDEIVQFVNEGKHKDKKLKVQAFKSMLETLCGWDNACGDAEETAVIDIMLEAEKRGFLAEAMADVKGSMYTGSDQVLYKLDGTQDEKARAIISRQTNLLPSNAVLDEVLKRGKFDKDFQDVALKITFAKDKMMAMSMYNTKGKAPAMQYARSVAK